MNDVTFTRGSLFPIAVPPLSTPPPKTLWVYNSPTAGSALFKVSPTPPEQPVSTDTPIYKIKWTRATRSLVSNSMRGQRGDVVEVTTPTNEELSENLDYFAANVAELVDILNQAFLVHPSRFGCTGWESPNLAPSVPLRHLLFSFTQKEFKGLLTLDKEDTGVGYPHLESQGFLGNFVGLFGRHSDLGHAITGWFPFGHHPDVFGSLYFICKDDAWVVRAVGEEKPRDYFVLAPLGDESALRELVEAMSAYSPEDYATMMFLGSEEKNHEEENQSTVRIKRKHHSEHLRLQGIRAVFAENTRIDYVSERNNVRSKLFPNPPDGEGLDVTPFELTRVAVETLEPLTMMNYHLLAEPEPIPAAILVYAMTPEERTTEEHSLKKKLGGIGLDDPEFDRTRAYSKICFLAKELAEELGVKAVLVTSIVENDLVYSLPKTLFFALTHDPETYISYHASFETRQNARYEVF